MYIAVPATLAHSDSQDLFRLQAATNGFEGAAVTLRCVDLRFIDPLGLCVLHHWFKDLEQREIRVNLEELPLDVETWLRRMDLFADLTNLHFEDRTSTNSRNDHRGSLIEVRSVHSLRDIDSVANEIALTIIHGVPDVSWSEDPEGMRASEGEVLSGKISYVFSELLNNSLDHGRTRGYKDACAKVAAQYYPRLGKLKVAIVDNGCGLLETLRGHPRMEGIETDLRSIQTALEPKVSCNRDVGLRDAVNEGIGLTMSTQMALSANGKIGIFSGVGRLQGAKGEPNFTDPIEYWQGTAVFLEFDRAELTRQNGAIIAREITGYREVPELNFG